MKGAEIKNLRDEVIQIKKHNIEEFLLMTKYCLIAYNKSMISFGIWHDITADVLNVWREFIKNLEEERKILNFLLSNASLEDMEEVNEFMMELDDLNEDVIQYYYLVLDGIEDACDMKVEWKAKRPKKTFESLIESNKYHNRLCDLVLNIEDIKRFLGYEEEFWDYIDKRTYFVDSHFEEDREFYGINMKFDNERLVDIKIFVPEIVNLETAFVNVCEFEKAYSLYQLVGQMIKISDVDCSLMNEEMIQQFKTKYMVKKYQQTFNRR